MQFYNINDIENGDSLEEKDGGERKKTALG